MIETTSHKIVIVTLTRVVKIREYEDIQLLKIADEVNKRVNTFEQFRSSILPASLNSK